MNKRVLNISLILMLASTGSVFAQQGFGTNNPSKSSAVDIVSPNKGLLIPRVALQQDINAAPITNPDISLMVYNTTVSISGNLKAGYYFWNGSKWERFTSESNDLNTTNVSLAVENGKLILKDSDGNNFEVNTSDINTDDQKITTFEIGTNNVLTLTLEDGGTKTVNLSPYFNSTKLENGTNTTVTGTGLETDKYKVNVANASATNLGVVQVGENIQVDANGIISVNFPPGTVDTDNQQLSLTGNVLSLDRSTPDIDLGKYDTKLVDGVNTTVIGDGSAIPYAVNVTFPTIEGNETKLISGNNTTVSGSGTITDQYKVDVATGNVRTLGVVRESENPTINVTNGELSINVGNTNLLGEVTGPLNATIVQDDVIDAANLKTAAVTPIKIEPALTFVQTQVMVTGTDGVVKWVDQSTISPTTTVSNLSDNNNLITTVNGVNATSVDLVKTVSLSLNGSNLTTTVNGVSNATPLNLSALDTNTDDQQLSLTGNVLSLDRSTPDIDLGKYDTKLIDGVNTTVTGDGSAIPYAVNVTFPAETVDTNTTNKVLEVSGTNLVLTDSDNASVQIALADLDKQQISYDQATKLLTLERGGIPVDLSTLSDPITSNLLSTSGTNLNTLGSTVNGVNSNTVELINTVGLSLNGTNLTSTVNGVSNTTPLDISSLDTNTDEQKLSLTGNVLNLERGGTVNLSIYDTKLANGTNSTVSGTGLSTDPYKVNVDLSTIDGTETKLINGTNTTVTGTGTQSMPYQVGVNAATAKVGATAGSFGVVKPGDQFKVETDGHLSVKYAIPEFFYYPAINIKLDANSLDLYGIFKARFESTTLPKSPSAESTSLASLVLPANMVDIYVTYYDTNVIENVTIDAAGKMNYSVKTNYTLSDESYMNIVFKVRKTPRP